jgi:hypothetical protein
MVQNTVFSDKKRDERADRSGYDDEGRQNLFFERVFQKLREEKKEKWNGDK